MSKDFLQFYISFAGRATRRDFNIGALGVIILGMVVAAILDGFTDHFYFATAWNYISFLLLLPVTGRRLHDMGLSSWWQTPFQILTLALMFLMDFYIPNIYINPTTDKSNTFAIVVETMLSIPTGMYLFLLISMIVILIFIILLSSKQGIKGSNKYGADPLQI